MPVVYSRKRLRAEAAVSKSNILNDDNDDEESIRCKKKPVLEETKRVIPVENRIPYKQIISSKPKRQQQKKKRNFTQLHLDFGQRDSGPIRCAQCGLLYVRGAGEDEITHKRFHTTAMRANKPPTLGRAVASFVLRHLKNGVIIGVRTTDEPALRRRVALVDKWVSNRLGGYMRAMGSEIHPWLAVLFVAKELVKGYLLAEEVDVVNIGNVRDDGVVETSSTTVPGSFCGIRKIWVDESCRRSGIAATLLDTVRHNLVYGRNFEENQVAFTPMTTDGGHFAKAIAHRCGMNDVLVYTPSEIEVSKSKHN